MTSKADFFQGLRLRPRPETQLTPTIRFRSGNPNSLLARPSLHPASLSNENLATTSVDPLTLSPGLSSTRTSLRMHSNSFSGSRSQLITSQRENSSSSVNQGDKSFDQSKEDLVQMRERIIIRQAQNNVVMKRMLNVSAPHYNTSPTLASLNANHLSHNKDNICPSNVIVMLEKQLMTNKSASAVSNPKLEAKIRDKRVKFLKHLSNLEFSSLLFRRTYLRISCLTNKINYEQILSYDRYCGTSNKALIKQSLIKTQMFKCKTSRSRTRMLRSTELVNGKLTEQWQRCDYTHIYCFNKRQRLRRYFQIQRAFGFRKRILRLSYGRLQIILPKLEECPSCKEKLNADRGHCCARRKSRSTKNVSLLADQSTTLSLFNAKRITTNNNNSNSMLVAKKKSISNANHSLSAASASTFNRFASTHNHPSGHSTSNQFTECTTLMSINQDRTEYYDYRPDQFDIPSLNNSTVAIENDADGEDITIIKVSTPLPASTDASNNNMNASNSDSNARRKCGSTLLLDSSNFKDSSPIVVKRIAYESELQKVKSNQKSDDKTDTTVVRRVKPNQCTNRIPTKVITIAHENRLPLEKSIQIA